MLLETLPFGQLLEIEKNIVEATIFEGMELNRQHMTQIFMGLDRRYHNERYAVLSNRVYRYSHTHESMQAIAKQSNLAGFAILVYSSISTVAAGIHELYQDNSKVFYSQPAALEWLRERLASGGESNGVLLAWQERAL